MRRPGLGINRRVHALVHALTFVAFTGPARAQRVATPPIGPPRTATATLTEDFTQVSGVRELADGRVIISDSREVRVVVADFATQRVELIGRKGMGPGEYSRPSSMYPMSGDSTLVYDGGAGRWLILSGARIVATLPPDDPAHTATFAGIRYVDDRGSVAGWSVDRPNPGIADAGVHDSGTIVFVRRGSSRVDTVAKVVRTPQRFFAWTDPITGTPQFNASAAAFATSEDFLLFPDGWLAVIRLNPYRVDWRSPNGAWTLGPPVPVPLARVTDREKAFYLKRFERAVNAPVNISPNAPPSVRDAMANSARRRWTEFPEFIPPFMGMSSLPAPEGTVIVLKTPTADAPNPTYDSIDRTGKLVRRIGLAAGQRIVGFGKHGVYIVSADSDGLERISRHPWP